jgi:5'-deoxynucleotidase YfbR-like HD superfamily hydrolase
MSQLQQLTLRFAGFFHGSQVRRYHTATPLREQTVADHSFGVAMLSLLMAEGTTINPVDLLTAALTHDLSEFLVGDTPSPAKTNGHSDDKENQYQRIFGWAFAVRGDRTLWRRGAREVSVEVALTVKLADILEGLIWSYREHVLYRNASMVVSLRVYRKMFRAHIALMQERAAINKDITVVIEHATHIERLIQGDSVSDFEENVGFSESIRHRLEHWLQEELPKVSDQPGKETNK